MIFLAVATLITLDFQDFGPLGTIQNGARESRRSDPRRCERIASPITDLWEGATATTISRPRTWRSSPRVDRLRGELVQSGIDRGDYEALLEQSGLEAPRPTRSAHPSSQEQRRKLRLGCHRDRVGNIRGSEEGHGGRHRRGPGGSCRAGRSIICLVRLVSDPDFVIGAEVAGEVGLALGIGSNSEMRIEQGLKGRAEVELGDPVTTTRSDRSSVSARTSSLAPCRSSTWSTAANGRS